jgi:tetratricopeptide (TPR) repeat protein
VSEVAYRVRALKASAQVARDTGDPGAAIAPYEEAVTLCRSSGDPRVLAHTIRHLGEVLFEVDRLAEADDCLTEAVDLYRRHGASGDLSVANAVRPLAILREAQGRLNEAVALWTEARAGYATADIDAGVQEADDRLSRLRSLRDAR